MKIHKPASAPRQFYQDNASSSSTQKKAPAQMMGLPEKEELQMKPDPLQFVQVADEEELQMKKKPMQMMGYDEEKVQMKPMQLMGYDEEEELQMKPMQMQGIEEEEVQMKPMQFHSAGSEKVQMKSDTTTKMPEHVQAKMESSFGTDFSNVNIHTGEQASSVGALAYAQGNDIHFAPGRYNPETQSGQELLGHELTHVVQQRQGRVQTTTQAKGLAVNDDPALEHEADVMGKKAAEGKEVSVKGIGYGIQKQNYPLGASESISDFSGAFRIGPPSRPSINHDNGFLDVYEPRDPNVFDRMKLMKWRGMLEASEALRPDLVDANAAYRHFLSGNGADRNFSYERYVENDPSGALVLNNAIQYTKIHAQNLCIENATTQIVSSAFTTGQAGPFVFPYPQTENWQKAIGGHNMWISAGVQCLRENNRYSYSMIITLHIEDRYNFNPGQADIATGIPDSDNGLFEITGLGHQYMNFSTLTRNVAWTSVYDEGGVTSDDQSRHRRPSDNRRLRNRL
ncbi:MAG: DUF4157 domain-containing protein [Cytophagaceae bacterium]